MHEHLIGYLRDNRDQIIESWLTGANIPAADCEQSPDAIGSVPLGYFADAFDSILQIIETGKAPTTLTQEIHLDDFLGVSCNCRTGSPSGRSGRVCIELHDSGLNAFLSVFEDDWDASHEFDKLDREKCADIINHALSGLISNEIEHCRYKDFRSDCPFISIQADTDTAT
ncbi:hypothetical protein [Coraliomargarita akajimensis]|uniref:Uncharacterized protein n=1 Tax=Coraliomargarita akajimensis (strain DSM 45221 / IAM 15411 / JCM 23193 / KCTC 12865 / 04OKA010-24) TaxID=583355 RepID=D5EJ81_CORAD|nr:hypothetical protein [Coraliomargarita akajimensis]ADE54480.1 hypothetical protein Caka_1461 [Coraliomargarita akajimensis DSM 45221]